MFENFITNKSLIICQLNKKCLELKYSFVSLFSSVKREDYANTFEFLDKIAENLKAKMS